MFYAVGFARQLPNSSLLTPHPVLPVVDGVGYGPPPCVLAPKISYPAPSSYQPRPWTTHDL